MKTPASNGGVNPGSTHTLIRFFGRWGYVASAGREATQAIAEQAIQEGYTVIKFYFVEVPGSVNYAIFENFQQILTPREVIPVPWSTAPPVPAPSP